VTAKSSDLMSALAIEKHLRPYGNIGQNFLPARRYASAGTSYGLLSVISRCSIESLDGSSGLLSISPTLCYKKIWVFRTVS